MGKRLKKADLLHEIGIERRTLDGLLSGLKPRQMSTAGVTKAGWSVKDILGHLIGWQELNLGWHESAMLGGDPDIPAKGFGWGDIRELNEQIFRQHRRRSLRAVRSDFETLHQRMLELIESVPEKHLVAIGQYSWTGKSWSLSDYIRANTASHYRWATKHIRRWVRKSS